LVRGFGPGNCEVEEGTVGFEVEKGGVVHAGELKEEVNGVFRGE
jgi:hypothetical protein